MHDKREATIFKILPSHDLTDTLCTANRVFLPHTLSYIIPPPPPPRIDDLERLLSLLALSPLPFLLVVSQVLPAVAAPRGLVLLGWQVSVAVCW